MMEERLDTHLAQADRYSVEDGEADGLVGCWLCPRYFKPHLLLDGLLCPDCAEIPGMPKLARIAGECEELIDGIERTRQEYASLTDAIKEAARLAAQAVEKSEEKPKITVEDIWGE
jgi:hypothetical protein